MNRLAIHNEYVRINRKFEEFFFPKVRKAIREKQTSVIHHLRNGGIDAALHFLHSDTGNEQLMEVVRDLYQQVGVRHAKLTYSRLLVDAGKKSYSPEMIVKGFGFNEAWTNFILKYLNRFLLEKITYEVARTTRDALLTILATATTQGWSIDQTVDKIDNWPGERFQAARVVRTETNRAANVGSKAQASTSAYEQMKEWISAHDSRVRGSKPKEHANHVKLDRQKIDEEDVFVDSINGDNLDIPGDPTVSAASTVNCRCHAAFTLKRDAQGNPIPKRKTTVVLYPSQTRTRVAVVI